MIKAKKALLSIDLKSTGELRVGVTMHFVQNMYGRDDNSQQSAFTYRFQLRPLPPRRSIFVLTYLY